MEISTPANSGNYYPSADTTPLRTSDWFWTMFITAIPLVGFIMLLIWSFGSGNNVNKANWAKATLLWIVVVTGFYALILVIFGLSFLSASGNNY